MKISFVSSQAVSQALRYQMMRMQADLHKSQQEAVTGRAADVGVALGARAGYTFSLTRESERLKGLIDSNQLAASRLASTQIAMRQMTDTAQDLVSSFTTALSGTSDNELPRQDASEALGMMTSLLNSSLNGEHLFAGINTDVRPIADFTDPASANRVAFDQSFQIYFGFSQTDPAVATITKAQMEDFITTEVEPQFLGAGWAANWSTATDQQIVSRITLSETAETSVTANAPGIRKMTMAVAMVSNLLQGELGQGARDAVLTRANELLGEVVVDLANEQSLAGLAEQRIAAASDRLSLQMDLFANSVSSLEGVDPYAAATHVNSLLTQIEVSYALTARIQQLSLLRYLGT